MTRKRNPTVETNARRAARAKRIDGPNGSWPAMRAKMGGGHRGGANVKSPHAPKPPAICFLYPDLNDPAEADERTPAPVFGQYPVLFIEKILPWLRCRASEVLHVCSGSLAPGVGMRIDIRADAVPDIVADGRALPIRTASVAAVMLDPPYTEQYARDLYGTSYPRPAHLLAEAARVVRPAGRILIVHYITPNPPPGCSYLRSFGLSTGIGFPMRAVTIFEREQATLDLAEGVA